MLYNEGNIRAAPNKPARASQERGRTDELATTTGDFDRFCPTYQERLAHVAAAGFRYADLSLYTLTKGEPLLADPNRKAYAVELRDFARSLGVEFVQAHSVGSNPLLRNDVWQAYRPFSGDLPGTGDPPYGGNRQRFPRDTRLTEARCFMQDDLEKLLYHVGEYALKTYGLFES